MRIRIRATPENVLPLPLRELVGGGAPKSSLPRMRRPRPVLVRPLPPAPSRKRRGEYVALASAYPDAYGACRGHPPRHQRWYQMAETSPMRIGIGFWADTNVVPSSWPGVSQPSPPASTPRRMVGTRPAGHHGERAVEAPTSTAAVTSGQRRGAPHRLPPRRPAVAPSRRRNAFSLMKPWASN
jgi:hypothetical protein